MDDLEFFDSTGAAVAYSRDREVIYLWSGRPVAYLSSERVYRYSGAFFGWFIRGWIWDRHGRAMLFTPDAEGGPVRPARRARPAKGARSVRPARGARQAVPARPVLSSSWSTEVLE